MLTMDRRNASLLVVDFQARLMPAIDAAGVAVANARRLIEAAGIFKVPVLFTEQNAKGLGGTVPELLGDGAVVHHKMAFDVCRAPGFFDALSDRPEVVVAGCEAHVCVLQTVLGLLDAGRRVFVVRDAIGARRPESKETAIARMARHGAEIATTQALLLFNIGDAVLTAGELRTRGFYLGSNVSYNLKKLVELGFIDHQKSRVDRRAVRVSLTKAGTEVAAKVAELYDRHIGSIDKVGGLDEQEFQKMNKALQRLDR
ncbi:MAG TPA: isochorismatase family protein, partial [Paracoccaceae bacterium]|nr:isochorismatase family protein [Paracoccaceae bacterium]